jgi:hypothetical protein
VLASSTQVRGFKPGRSRRIIQGEKIPSTPSFGGEVKPAVPCRRFAACKRSLNVTWKSAFKQNSRLLFLALSSTSRCLALSRRVGRGDIWRRQWKFPENRVYSKPRLRALINNTENIRCILIFSIIRGTMMAAGVV